MWGKRTEHKDAVRFSEKLKRELLKYDICCEIFSGSIWNGFSNDDMILSFHRDGNMKNTEKYGASVLVPKNADAEIQYDAFRLLSALTGDMGFRNRGVHTFTEKSPFKSIEKSGSRNTFIFTLGFMDKDCDNRILDKNSDVLVKLFAYRLNKILKERENEDNA
ncbi:MAG: hypothetical protein IKL10_06815 [Clostridia bacterium]|nr:hypothetical protein [Clostridia bacterium]